MGDSESDSLGLEVPDSLGSLGDTQSDSLQVYEFCMAQFVQQQEENREHEERQEENRRQHSESALIPTPNRSLRGWGPEGGYQQLITNKAEYDQRMKLREEKEDLPTEVRHHPNAPWT